MKILRLILGDQLNSKHSWYHNDEHFTYLMMEIRQETDYVKHHIQKIACFFAAMRAFAEMLKSNNKKIIYITIDQEDNQQDLSKNIKSIIKQHRIDKFEYQLPDEYRLNQQLIELCKSISIPSESFDTEHFYTSRDEVSLIFKGKKTLILENFYRIMRQKHQILIKENAPEGGEWNFDKLNRSKYDGKVPIPKPLTFNNNLLYLKLIIENQGIAYFGEINWEDVIWPIDYKQSEKLLDYFIEYCLPNFGTFEDAMTQKYWSLFHSRLSFAMNIKLISPKEVIERSCVYYESNRDKISIQQIEGFVRQILGWREYMRGIYWMKMPEFEKLNFFDNNRALPLWFWDGNTKMNCLKHTIKNSLSNAYAHHIERLMVIGNFASLAGVHPDEVDNWYLGVYIDAIQWVEITNTRGMSQYADGGIVGSKPYVSTANYIDKMSDYCSNCYYGKNIKVGERACPFNSLYWHFYERNKAKLEKNPRIGMVYNILKKMNENEKSKIFAQAEYYLKNIDSL